MKSSSLTYLIISFVCSILSLVTFWIYSQSFGEQIIFWLGIPFSILLFCLFYFLANPIICRVTIISSSAANFLPFALFLVSIILVVLIPPYQGLGYNWVSIPLQNWLRGLASLLLTSFFPGYLFLKVIDKKRVITGGMLIVVSNILSMLFMFLIAFPALVLGYAASYFSFIAVLVINLSLAAMYCLRYYKRENTSRINLSIKGHESIVILSFCVVMVGTFVVMLYNMPLTRSDMWQIYSQALEFSRGFPQYISNYPYLFQIYLTTFFSTSGLPSSITMQLLYLLSFMPLLGFYSMAKQWFAEKGAEKIVAVATFFGVLLGFASLYMVYFKSIDPKQTFSSIALLAVNKTYDSYMRYPIEPYMVVLRWTINLTVLFALLYLLKINNCKLRNLLFVLLVVIGYVGYVVDIMLFLPLLLVWLIFFESNSEWKLSFSILLGYLGVGIIDYLAPKQIYLTSVSTVNGQTSISLPYFASLGVVFLLLGLEVAKSKGFSFSGLKQTVLIIAGKSWKYLKWVLLYFYLFCIVVCLYTFNNYNLWLFGGNNFVSFFLFPVRWGAVGLLFILSTFLYLPDILKNKTLSFFMLIFAIGVLLEQINDYFPLFEADRYASIICIGASVIAAYGVIRMLKSLTRTSSLKKTVSIFLLLLVIIPSCLSTAVYYADMSYLNGHKPSVTDGELSAFEYIKNNLSSNESVLTFTYASAFKLGTFVGISYQSLYPYDVTDTPKNIVTYGLLATDNPYIITYMLSTSNTRFIYVGKDDVSLLESNSVFNSFLNYLPIVVSNPDATVYEVPKLAPPSLNADSQLGIFRISLNNSLSFDGTDNYVEVQNTPLLQSGNITVDFRFKKVGDFTYMFPIDKSKNLWVSYAFMGTSDQKLCFMVGIDNENSVRKVTATTTFQDNRWYGVIGVYDGRRMAIYVDGNLENQTIFEDSKSIFYSGDYPLRLGTHVFENNSYFKGSIDYVNIYNNALTEDEINNIFRNEQPLKQDLVLSLNFNGNLNDDSGNKNVVVNHGATFSSSSISPDSDSFLALLISLLGSKYPIPPTDDMSTNSGALSNYNYIILTSDPSTPPADLVNWVSAGNTIAVFNTNGIGFFGDAVNIGSSSNLVTTKQFNSGKIIYFDIYPLLKSSNAQTILQTKDLVTTIESALSIQSYGNPISIKQIPGTNFNMTSGDFQITGNLSLSTNLLTLTNPSLSNLDNQTHSSMSIVTICGNTTLTIQNASFQFSPSQSTFVIKPKNNLVTGQITVDSKATIQANDLDNPTILNEAQTINFQAAEISVKSPQVTLSGNIIFGSLYVHVSTYLPLDGIVLQKTEVQGKVTFSTVYVSDPFSFFSSFKADGKILNLDQTTSSSPSISWINVLFSSYSIAFNVAFFVCVSLYLIKKRYMFRFHKHVTNSIA